MNVIKRFLKKRTRTTVEGDRVSRAVSAFAETADEMGLTAMELALSLGALQQMVMDETGACAVSDEVLLAAVRAVGEEEGE